MSDKAHRHPGGLGRVFKDDPRDIPLEALTAAEAEFTSGMTLEDLANDKGFEHWKLELLWKYILTLRSDVPPPSPKPKPATAKLWADPRPTLDQGQTNHCVGNGCAQWGNSEPVSDKFKEIDAANIYYAAKVIDGEPGEEDGSSVRSGMKALQNMGRLAAYARPANINDLRDWILQRGSVAVGTNWYESMFTLDADNRATITDEICPDTHKPVAGGHCYLVLGYDASRKQREFECLNSWGASFGKNGHFFIAADDLNRLVFKEAGGEAWCAVELPLP